MPPDVLGADQKEKPKEAAQSRKTNQSNYQTLQKLLFYWLYGDNLKLQPNTSDGSLTYSRDKLLLHWFSLLPSIKPDVPYTTGRKEEDVAVSAAEYEGVH